MTFLILDNHATGVWRLEIAGPELGVIEGVGFQRDIECFEEGSALRLEYIEIESREPCRRLVPA
jgi:hypothetical protein